MKHIITLVMLAVTCNLAEAQVYSNVSKPYSEKAGLELNLDEINTINIDAPHPELLKQLPENSYAKNIKVDINIIAESKKIKLVDGKSLHLLRLKNKGAKSLNFSFEDFYLSKGSKMFIYTHDNNQIMGPITNLNNQDNFNTHLIMSDDVIFEIYSDDDSKITLSDIGYGLKNINYFTEITSKLIKNKNNTTQSSDCIQAIEDTKDNCNHVGSVSPLSEMKQANCNEYDHLEKQKRSICIIISQDPNNGSWHSKGGVLINTADENANNYCNSYVLTCWHCMPFDNPSYLAVRFNWIREECEIPPGIDPCSQNVQAWKDLINMDEVMDYCDVELVNREIWGGSTEYGLLKINNVLKGKEYFSGWKIYANPNGNIINFDPSYVIGPFGQTPLEIGVYESMIFDYNTEIALTPTLTSGHSGNSIFDESGYLLGIAAWQGNVTYMGQLYDNTPNGFWDDFPLPRETLDPNGIYAQDFTDRKEIVVEGVERWEKSDCFMSANDCDSELDMSDYITAVSNIDGVCCFKIDFIDPNENFNGGKPYGIRIHRPTGRQQTLLYEFSDQVLIPDDEQNYTPIEFCIESSDLTEDNNSVTVEFLDAQGKIMCRKDVTINCAEPCENCDTEEFQSWLQLSSEKFAAECDSNECYVSAEFEIPEGYECYTHVVYSSTLEDDPADPEIMLEVENFDISNFNKCIPAGMSYQVKIGLLKGEEDTDTCYIVDDVYCSSIDTLAEPCKADCFEVDFEGPAQLKTDLPSCPGCKLKIFYYWRTDCHGNSEIQIAAIEQYPEAGSPQDACDNCGLNDEDLYKIAVKEVIAVNEMGFVPDWDKIKNENGDTCSTQWRVSKASCWINFTNVIYVITTPEEEPESKVINIYQPCNSDCCVRQFEVCRYSKNNITIKDLGEPIASNNNCDSVYYQPPALTDSVNCVFTCDFLQNLDESYTSPGGLAPPPDIDTENDNYRSYFKGNSNGKVIYNQNEFQVKLNSIDLDNISLEIFNYTGQKVKVIDFNSTKISDNFNIDVSDLSSGSYFYNITSDNKLHSSGSFMIVE